MRDCRKNGESCCPEDLSAGQMKKIVAESISLAALCWLEAAVSSQHCPGSDYLDVTELLRHQVQIKIVFVWVLCSPRAPGCPGGFHSPSARTKDLIIGLMERNGLLCT